MRYDFGGGGVVECDECNGTGKISISNEVYMDALRNAALRFCFFNGFALLFYLAFGLFLNGWLAFFVTLNFMHWLYPVLIRDVTEFEPQLQKAYQIAKSLATEIYTYFKGVN